jgi:putative methyltransferase (TIGR04325 family)
MKVRTIAKDWLPPAVQRLMRRAMHRRDLGIFLDGDYITWEKAKVRCSGYDDKEILAKVLDATLKVKRGEAACERDSMLFDEMQYFRPVLAGLMWAAARNGGRLNVLDFDGALGSSYFQNRKFLQTLSEVHWNVVEQSNYVDAGQANIQNQNLRFYKTIKDCLDENQSQVILLSSVLQYLKEPEKLLEELTSLGIENILIDRTSFMADGEQKRIFVQHVPKSIYKASYPIWLFNENEFVRILSSKGYELIESFDALDSLDDRGVWKVFFFCRRGDHVI